MAKEPTWKSRIGQIADDHVLACRRARFPSNTFISDGYLYEPHKKDKESLRINWCNLSGSDAYLAMIRVALQTDRKGGNYLSPSVEGYAVKPDLVDIEAREVWEVKPKGAPRAAQLALYLSLMNTAEREYLALSRHHRYFSDKPFAPVGVPRPWYPGTDWKIAPMEHHEGQPILVEGKPVTITFEVVKPGVIQWAKQ